MDVIEPRYHTMINTLSISTDFEEMQRVHNQFLDEIVRLSFMENPALKQKLLMTLDFCKKLSENDFTIQKQKVSRLRVFF